MDKEEVKRTLSILHEPDEVVEVRILKTGYKKTDTQAGYFNDINKCCHVLECIDGTVPAIYMNLNPVTPALLGRANNRLDPRALATAQDKDVLRRRWLYLDIDPERLVGVSST